MHDISPRSLRMLKAQYDKSDIVAAEEIEAGTEAGRWGSVAFARWPAFLYALAIRDHALVRTTGVKLIDAVQDALFGDWRIGYSGWDEITRRDVVWDAVTARANFNWAKPYRCGLVAAVTVDEWAAAMNIAQYVDGSGLPNDDASVNDVASPGDIEFYMTINRVIRGKDPNFIVETPSHSDRLSRRVRTLRACADTLGAKDSAGFDAAIDSYLRQYHRYERDRESSQEWLSIDGTILYYVAGRSFGCLPKLKTDMRKYIALLV